MIFPSLSLLNMSVVEISEQVAVRCRQEIYRPEKCAIPERGLRWVAYVGMMLRTNIRGGWDLDLHHVHRLLPVSVGMIVIILLLPRLRL
jgi:hypothetical protein